MTMWIGNYTGFDIISGSSTSQVLADKWFLIFNPYIFPIL